RAAAGPERALGRDVARRPAPAADSRLRPAAAMAPQAVSRAAGDDRALAGVRPDRPELRRARQARLLLHRELVDLARHHDPRQDAAGGARSSRGVLTSDLGGHEDLAEPDRTRRGDPHRVETRTDTLAAPVASVPAHGYLAGGTRAGPDGAQDRP